MNGKCILFVARYFYLCFIIMKKGILLLTAVVLTANIMAQCSQIFISEYIEGSRNNKAIELYNPTDKDIDLKDYRMTRWSNGSAVWSSQYSDKLSGTIKAKSTFNLVIDRTDSTASGFDTSASKVLLDKADLLLSKDYNTSFSMSFNGDDALSLDIIDPSPMDPSNPYLPIDIFGKIGERPRLGGSSRTIGWSDSFPHNNGLGLWYTIDKTLIRKKTVLDGVSSNPTSFDPSKEWIAHPRDQFDSFGMHECDCRTLNKSEIQKNNLILFPNPAGTSLFVPFHGVANKLEILNLAGKLIEASYTEHAFAQMRGYQVDLSAVIKGQYIMILTDSNGIIHTERFIRE